MAMTAADCITKKIVDDVQSTFSRLQTALKSRETQLLRQIDVIVQQYKLGNGNMKCFNKINVVFESEVDILKAVSNFGIIDFEGISLQNNIYKIEDYENPNCDHVCMYKCLEKLNNVPDIINVNPEKADNSQLFKYETVDCKTDPDSEMVENEEQTLPDNDDLKMEDITSDYQNLIEKCDTKQLLCQRKSFSGLGNFYLADGSLVNNYSISESDTDHCTNLTLNDNIENKEKNTSLNKIENDPVMLTDPSSTKEIKKKLLETHMDSVIQNNESNIKDINDLRKGLKYMIPQNENINLNDSFCKNSVIKNKTFNLNSVHNVKSENINSNNSEITAVKSDLLQFHNSISKIFDPCLTKNIKEYSPNKLNTQNYNYLNITNNCNYSPSNIKKPGRELLIKSKSSNNIETGNKSIKTEKVRKVSLEHPIQVQQWMTQIINEPEIEPVQNTELLEHVNIAATL